MATRKKLATYGKRHKEWESEKNAVVSKHFTDVLKISHSRMARIADYFKKLGLPEDIEMKSIEKPDA